MVALVVAHSRNRVIGREGGLPWHLPTDLRFFKELTTGGTVVMGRRTYASIPDRFRPLPQRRNIVLSADPGFRPGDGAEVFGSLDAALEATGRDCFVIGGGRTYAEALPKAQRVHATEIDADVEGDTFFPALPADEWHLAETSDPVTENGHTFRFCRYDRRG